MEEDSSSVCLLACARQWRGERCFCVCSGSLLSIVLNVKCIKVVIRKSLRGKGDRADSIANVLDEVYNVVDVVKEVAHQDSRAQPTTLILNEYAFDDEVPMLLDDIMAMDKLPSPRTKTPSPTPNPPSLT
ncbi:hypothetical protein LR48_Vigan10g169000 [Vigna angularis]|uniref:Uncharacterized protein n=1 Tax=Phaseolus angularis TaxID=3914 RepID=A0A0L9VLE9_PHAAN|nr:hypothetical protein LR48_Vigan10g169000 [Vigna angularis]